MIIDETKDIHAIDRTEYETIEELNKDNNTNLSEEDFKEDDFIVINGFDNYGEFKKPTTEYCTSRFGENFKFF